MEIALGRILDEADHALNTEAKKPLEILRKNMKAIIEIARQARREASDSRSGGL
jgi:mevalonate pyrophosphate decarboxylase